MEEETSQSASVVVLFYCYESLGAARAEEIAAEQRRLGADLGLCGRVLVAAEGINGTVQGQQASVAAYEAAVELRFPCGVDWKRSSGGAGALFPDFVVKEVPELVSFSIRTNEPLDVRREAGVKLSPRDFDRVLAETPSEQLRVIDVRNSFEYEVGHFEGAIDPGMQHAAQWPRFVEKHLEDLRGRSVLLYCTGGIRCEKASAYLCRRLKEAGNEERCLAGKNTASSVYQLGGGIHRYLEAFPEGGHFRGANFVFDRRAQMRPGAASVVGSCSECGVAWDVHHGGRVCCVCRALVLVCDDCDAASSHGEYYCSEHGSLRGIYYHFVDRFSAEELRHQASALRVQLAAEVGTHRKNRRATLRKKAEQLEARLLELQQDCGQAQLAEEAVRRCRACERPYQECPGACWGFWRREQGTEGFPATA